MTPDELEAIREMCEAATPAPWEGPRWRGVIAGLAAMSGAQWAADSAFIRCAREAVPALLAALSEAKQPHDDRFLAVLKTDWEEAQQKAAALSIVEENFRELERQLELAQPVLEAARALRDAQRRDILLPGATKEDLIALVKIVRPAREAFEAAVDTYETQEGTE